MLGRLDLRWSSSWVPAGEAPPPGTPLEGVRGKDKENSAFGAIRTRREKLNDQWTFGGFRLCD